MQSADIIVATTAVEGYSVLQAHNITKPHVLNSPVLHSPEEQGQYYIKSSANVSKQVTDNIKEAVKLSTPKQEDWTLNIAGDIIIGRTVYEQQMKRNDYTRSFVKVKDLLSSTYYTVANAEWTAAHGIAYPL